MQTEQQWPHSPAVDREYRLTVERVREISESLGIEPGHNGYYNEEKRCGCVATYVALDLHEGGPDEKYLTDGRCAFIALTLSTEDPYVMGLENGYEGVQLNAKPVVDDGRFAEGREDGEEIRREFG